MSRIGQAFARRRSEGGKAFVAFLTAGDPSLERTVEAAREMELGGADVLELGVPFSDPLADGPVIHAAGTEALARGATPRGVMGVCERIAENVPVVLMIYYNLIFAAGPKAFALRACAAGASGVIVPDLPHDEADEVREACDAEGLALVPLVAPTTTPERITQIGAGARGFVYTVSLTGTTGERNQLAPRVRDTVAAVRASTDVPVAVGFGISTADQARAVAEVADGVIVGSRIVRAAGEGGAAAVRALVADFAGAVS